MLEKDAWSGESYDVGSYLQRVASDSFLKYLKIKANDEILDIGCGPGSYTQKLSELVPAGRILGVDKSHSMLSVAQKKYSRVTNLQFEHQDMEALSFDTQFDLVVSFWCLQWASDVSNVFKGIFRALKPGGRLFVIMSSGDEPFYQHYLKVKESGQYACLENFQSAINYSQLNNLDSKVADTGFKAVRVTQEERSFEMQSFDIFTKFVNGLGFFQASLSADDCQLVNEGIIDSFRRHCEQHTPGRYFFDFSPYLVRAEK